MRTRPRLLVRLVTAGALLASLAGASMVSASAALARPAAQSTSCHMKAILKFNPGLTFNQAQQKIRVKGKLSNCQGGGVTSATFAGRGSGDLSCTSGTGNAKLNVVWNTLETSVLSITIDIGSQSFSGTVTSGKFAGESLTASNITFTVLQGDCFFSPVTKARVTATVGV